MREFCKFSPEFWSGSLAEKLKEKGRDALLLAAYVQTNRHSNMLGVYYLPLAYMSYDTGIPLESISALLNDLSTLNFCHYDFEHSMVWVVELGLLQTGGALKEHDKRVRHLQQQYQGLPRVIFLEKFYEKYHSLYHLSPLPEMLYPKNSPLEGPSEALRSKKKNKKNYKEKKKENKNENTQSDVALLRSCGGDDHVQTVFDHWKAVMDHPQAKLDEQRKKIIQRALKNYSVEQLCQAITGCSYTPHNMGVNDKGQRFDGLHLILRDAEQIERFICHYHTPPRLSSKGEQLGRRNAESVQSWWIDEEQNHGAH